MGAIGAPCKLRFAASGPINNRPQVTNPMPLVFLDEGRKLDLETWG
jgi:hypothetical protein